MAAFAASVGVAPTMSDLWSNAQLVGVEVTLSLAACLVLVLTVALRHHLSVESKHSQHQHYVRKENRREVL